MHLPRLVRSVLTLLAGCLTVAGFVAGVLFPSPVLAHADLVATNPPDQALLADPVLLIELTFSEGVEPSGRGFRLLDSDGVAVPSTAFQPEAEEVIIEPESPLTNGRFVVIWQAQSADSHVLNGSFSFTIEGADVGSTEGGGDEDATADGVPETSTTAPIVTVTTTLPESAKAAPPAILNLVPPIQIIEGEQETSVLSSTVGDIGRWATMVGALMAIGAFAFAATALVGTPDEIRRSVRWIRRGCTLVIGGTLLEVAAVAFATSPASGSALSPTHILQAVGVQFGIAVILRLVGAIAMLQDPRSLVVSRGTPILDMRRSSTHTIGPSLPEDKPTGTTVVETAQPYRIEVQHEWVMIAGMVAVVASFALDGHSVDSGIIGRIASMVHVVAAGVWFGGLIVMGDTLIRRWKAAVDTDAAFMAVRFSRVAAVSLTFVAIAGIVLTWTIVDAPSEILTTAWGRLLLIKVALVAVVAAIGAYNHFRIVPGITDDAADHKAALLRRTTRIESAILVAVLGITAILVAAAV